VKIGDRYSTEMATAGRPAEALAAAALDLALGPYVLELTVAHDDGCPCTTGRNPMAACTCEVVALEGTRIA